MLSQIRLSVRLSVTRVDQSETVEVRIMQFYRTVAPSLYFLGDKFHPEILTESVRAVASNKCGLRETCYFRSSNAFARWLHKLELLLQL